MAEFIPSEVRMTIAAEAQEVPLQISETAQEYSMTLATAIEVIAAEPYLGPYTATPGPEAQELQTAGLQMLQNITIEPIPENYGRITWDGSTITVS